MPSHSLFFLKMNTIGRARLFFKISILLILSAFASFFFASCDTVHDDAYIYYSKSSLMYISLALNNSKNAAVLSDSSTSSSRTILPSEIDLADSSQNYYFYIWGSSVLGSVSPRKVDFTADSSTTGTIELNFPLSTYTFVLAATTEEPSDISDGSKILENAVLVGYTQADLNYSKNVTFYLSDEGLSGTGTVRVALLLDSSWSETEINELADYTVTAGIYNIKTGESVLEHSVLSVSGVNKSTPKYFSVINVPSGTYNFTVKFSKAGNNAVYPYSDRIIISPHRSVDTTVSIPNVVEKAPDAPTNFRASYCMDERFYSDCTELKQNTVDSYSGYGLLLSWEDNASNEAYFRITLANVSKMNALSSVPDTFTDDNWAALLGSYALNTNVVKVYDRTCTSAGEYIAGSLERNNTSLILYLPFDSCYVAKIEAVNDAGISSACYAKIDEDFSITVEDIGTVYAGKAFSTATQPTNVINRYKIEYHFNDGTYSYKDANGNTLPENPITKFVSYGTYGSNGKAFLCPIAESGAGTESAPSLIYDSSRWRRWVIGSVNGPNLITLTGGTTEGDETYSYQEPNDYTGYTSLYLFARYD